MAVRIYTLAKELKIDSKELVDLCTRAGIQDKGSALASMTDEEVGKLKEFIANKSRPPERPAPVAPVKPAAPTTTPAAAAKPPAVTESLKREDYIAPAGVSGKAKPAEPAPKPASTEVKPRPMVRPGGDGSKPVPRPAFKLAPVPAAGRAPITPRAGSSEPAAQKPDVKLPLDAIRSAKAGGAKPLADHMRKHEQQRAADAQRARTGGLLRGAAGGGPVAVPPPMQPGVRPRRTPSKTGGPADDTPGGRALRQLNRKRTDGRGMGDDDYAGRRRRGSRPRKGSGVSTAAPRKTNASIQVPCNVRAFSEAIGLSASDVLKKLLTFSTETMPSMATVLDRDTVELLAAEFGVQLDIKTAEDLEKELLAGFDAIDEDPSAKLPRAPVVTFLGHVDHGKTSLLDKILGIDVAARESGGITQHIRAYTVNRNDKTITFVDTPGHEAFTQMRARGASVTDVVVLVVAADDGVMPQTKEAVAHAKLAKVPIIVAVNKIDKPSADPERVRRELSELGLVPEEWGGETIFANVSATTGQGISELLEMLALQTEVLDLKANPKKPASGTVIEALLDRGRGPVARVLIQEGTLKVGDFILAGGGFGKVRAMTNEHGKPVHTAGPSTPVEILGLSDVPGAGDPVHAVKDPKKAQEIAESRKGKMAKSLIPSSAKVSLEDLMTRIKDADQQELRIIIKGDVQGSVEAVADALSKLSTERVKLSILHAAVGAITEGDINLAIAAKAIVIGFNVRPAGKASALAEENKIEIRLYSIIYNAVDDVKGAMEGLLPAIHVEKPLGKAEVRAVFKIRGVIVAGSYVIQNTIKRNAHARLMRGGVQQWEGKIAALKRFKEDVKDVSEGFECGISLDNVTDIKELDIIECFEIEEVKQRL